MEKEKQQHLPMSRRSFAIGVGASCALLATGALELVPDYAQVRPPGGQDEKALIAACIRCERCVEACPNNALRPAHLEDGIVSVRMPTSNFDVGWCDFCKEANGGYPLCVKACSTNALALSENATAENTILGKAVINKDWCLAWDKNNGCKFCYDACPYDAIKLNDNNLPVVETEKCNGCGACQCACVSLQEGSIAQGATSRAITVEPTINAS